MFDSKIWYNITNNRKREVLLVNLLLYERDQLLLKKSVTIQRHPLLLKVLDDYHGKDKNFIIKI